jgi:hypothetical protein
MLNDVIFLRFEVRLELLARVADGEPRPQPIH